MCAAAQRAAADPVAPPTQHAEFVGHNLETGPFLPFFVLPLARLNSPFDENQRTLLQILLRDFRLFSPNDDLVPLGALLAFARFVLVAFVGSHGKIGHCLAAPGVARLWIA